MSERLLTHPRDFLVQAHEYEIMGTTLGKEAERFINGKLGFVHTAQQKEVLLNGIILECVQAEGGKDSSIRPNESATSILRLVADNVLEKL